MANQHTVKTLRQRLESRFVVDPSTECWIWVGRRTPKDYGRYGPKLAHRVVYAEFEGPIPDGLELDHLCRNHPCVNPAHLEPVTTLVNQHRGEGVSGKNARKTRCPKGHHYDEMQGGRRSCRRCRLERQARYELRRRGGGVPDGPRP